MAGRSSRQVRVCDERCALHVRNLLIASLGVGLAVSDLPARRARRSPERRRPPVSDRGPGVGADDGTRTRDLNLGKVAHYQLCYIRTLRAGPAPGQQCSPVGAEHHTFAGVAGGSVTHAVLSWPMMHGWASSTTRPPSSAPATGSRPTCRGRGTSGPTRTVATPCSPSCARCARSPTARIRRRSRFTTCGRHSPPRRG